MPITTTIRHKFGVYCIYKLDGIWYGYRVNRPVEMWMQQA